MTSTSLLHRRTNSMNLIGTTIACVRRSIHRARCGFVVLAAVAGLACVATAATAGPAAAATSTSNGSATVTSYGFECNSYYHWVRENWPNIHVSGAANQQVYVRTFLYRWNGSSWGSAPVRTGALYVGVSNNTGRKALGTFGGLPYYFATNTAPSRVGPDRGDVFTQLTPGYYTTVEQYYTGSWWSANTAVAGTSNQTYCQV